MVKAVIVGSGRCGTLFLSRVLGSCGFTSEHELLFTAARSLFQPDRRAETYLEWDKYEILSANGAAAWYGKMPTETKVIHLIRDPVDHINSFLSLRIYSRALDPIAVAWRSRYIPYLMVEDELGRCIQHVVAWDYLCATASQHGHPYIPIRIEDLDTVILSHIVYACDGPVIPEHFLQSIMDHRRGDSLNSYEDRQRIIGLPPTPKIPREEVVQRIKEHKLHREVEQMSIYYGYGPLE